MIKRQFLLISTGRILQAIIAFAAIRAMTSFLSTDQVGYQYLINAIYTYFGLILINPIGLYLNRHIHGFHKNSTLKSFLKILNLYFLTIAVVSVPILYLIYQFFGVGKELVFVQLSLLIVANIYGSTWYQTLCSSLNLLNMRTQFVMISVFSQFIGFLSSVAAVHFIEKSAFYWISGNIIGQVIGGLISLYYFRKILRNESPKPLDIKILFNSEVINFCYPVAITAFLMWVQTQSYRVVVESVIGADQLAFLGVGLGIAASFFALAESIMSQYLMPQFYSAISNAEKKQREDAWNSQFKVFFIFYSLVLFYIFILAKPILNLVAHEKFSNVLPLIRWGVFIEFFRVLTNSIYSVSHVELKTIKSIKPYFLGALITISGVAITAFIFPQKALEYIPMALVLGSCSCLFIMYFEMKKLMAIHLSFKSFWKILAILIPTLGLIYLTDQASGIWKSLLLCSLVSLIYLGILYTIRNELKYIESDNLRSERTSK